MTFSYCTVEECGGYEGVGSQRLPTESAGFKETTLL